MNEKNDELQSFNLDDLDVEELERRLELVSTSVTGCWADLSCSSLSGCLKNA